ncbi:MAG TPA: hypothetical protein VFH73_03750 [Polyangia bacterium]|jgi:hypothetical protein|nr:hypothetical protein [Polyangia bacterium]
MSRDVDAKNARLFDRRTVERNIKKGLITRKDYEKYMKALDDAADKSTQGGEHIGADGAEDEDESPTEPDARGTNSH